MNITLNEVLWFAAGAVVGVAATSYFFKTKYERLYQEDVESVKRAFSMPTQTEDEDDDEMMDYPEPIDPAVIGYATIVGQNEYSDEETIAKIFGKEVKGVGRPHVISPADFDTLDDYEPVSLNYFDDGVLADEMGNVIDNVDAVVGRDSLNRFGEYEDDSVHVRNDAIKCDFEILRDLRKHSDVYHNGPRPDED